MNLKRVLTFTLCWWIHPTVLPAYSVGMGC